MSPVFPTLIICVCSGGSSAQQILAVIFCSLNMRINHAVSKKLIGNKQKKRIEPTYYPPPCRFYCIKVMNFENYLSPELFKTLYYLGYGFQANCIFFLNFLKKCFQSTKSVSNVKNKINNCFLLHF